MKTSILTLAGSLTGVAVLASAGLASAATSNTCTTVKHKVVHKTLARNAPAHRRVHVLADAPKGASYATAEGRAVERVPDRIYEREYAAYDVPPPPPPYPPYTYAAPYPVYPGPVFVGYGPRWGWGYHRGWRRW